MKSSYQIILNITTVTTKQRNILEDKHPHHCFPNSMKMSEWAFIGALLQMGEWWLARWAYSSMRFWTMVKVWYSSHLQIYFTLWDVTEGKTTLRKIQTRASHPRTPTSFEWRSFAIPLNYQEPFNIQTNNSDLFRQNLTHLNNTIHYWRIISISTKINEVLRNAIVSMRIWQDSWIFTKNPKFYRRNLCIQISFLCT